MRKFVICSLFLFPFISWAQNDYVPQSCKKMKSPASMELCEFSKKHQLPFYRISAIYLATIVHMTANKCHFKLTSQFFEGRAKALQNDEKFMNVYATFLKWNEDHFNHPNEKEFCKQSYETLGPHSLKRKERQLFE